MPILKKTTTAEWLNDQTYADHYSRLRLLATSMFEWKNLPNNISVRYLEQTLFERGQALFFNDPTKGYMVLECVVSGELNVYREPVYYTAVSINYNKRFPIDECVLIRNNYDMIPTMQTIHLFAMRLADMQRTIDVNIAAQKTPYILICDEKQRLTYLNALKQIKGNEPIVLGNSALNPEALRVIQTPAPFIADKIINCKHDLSNEACTFLGLNNANTDKAERLITDEATANDQMIDLFGAAMLLTRQEAAEQINERYGLFPKITVEYRVERLPVEPDPVVQDDTKQEEELPV